uniref:Uncharacterized protein n=1 Tax=Meloidogyne incognita TaxID=6306 RepID=A0A914NR28_MELIC
MAKYCLKKPSRRLTCKKKYKIQRKVREHSKENQKNWIKELFESSHDQYLVDSLPEIVESDGKSARTYASEVRKTIENADILIEVLDARDPIGSRSPKIEKLVIDKGKRLVLLLNKIDLVPKENVKKWLLYFR